MPALLAAAGLACSAVGLLDPALASGLLVAGPILAVVSLSLGVLRGSGTARLGFAALLAWAFAAAGWARPEFRADSASYYFYLRSAVFDRDLSFDNEQRAMGYPPGALTETGLRGNAQSAGPAVLWSPFYLAAHTYVVANRALGRKAYAADGYSAPYRRAPILGTVALALAGAWLLALAMAREIGGAAAALAVAGAVLASTTLYYVFVVPWMAHGAAFGAAAALLWACDRARREPSRARWTAVGALLGLVTLVRFQGAVYVLLVLPLALEGLHRRVVRPAWLLAAAAAGALAVSPQLLAWKILYGRFLTIPQGSGFMDWSSRHVLDVLVSANHGFFTWTPVMLLGAVGLLLGVRKDPPLSIGGLLVFGATAWTNGSVPGYDWSAGDAFGARRFDLVVPLMALGLGGVVSATARLAARAPLLVPAAALLALGLWNVGLIAAFRGGREYRTSAPLDRVAKDQARLLRRASGKLLGRVFGEPGRALAYKYFSGEYLYGDIGADGTIDVASADDRVLLGGWSLPRRKEGDPAFRWAFYPEACVSIALEPSRNAPLAVEVVARAPRRVQPQTLTLVWNGHLLGSQPLGPEWSETRRPLLPELLRDGENALCLRFSAFIPMRERQIAAAVVQIRFPKASRRPGAPGPLAAPPNESEDEP